MKDQEQTPYSLFLMLWIAGFLTLSSCVVTGSVAHFRRDALRRAAFEMECPESSLKLTDLQAAIGVDGCGKRFVYAFHQSAGWVKEDGTTRAKRD